GTLEPVAASPGGGVVPRRRPSAASRRLRRSRSVTTLVLVAALVGVGFGAAELLASGGWSLLAGSVVVAVGAVALLNQMAAVARMRRTGSAVRHPVVATELYDDAEHAEVVDRRWTPQPLPRPLYLDARERAVALGAAAGADAVGGADLGAVAASAHVNRSASQSELLAAAAAAEQALRDSQPARPSPAPSRETAPVAVESRFARMGIIDEAEVAPTDLDAILARRRAVG
ncbi:MAG TPA: hypothetical protein PK890_08275, partial [Terrimesophilobacter sp.]|nr:hypothetical protein [Terrimesophilobacter sp.]